jgi:hypothetical protein
VVVTPAAPATVTAVSGGGQAAVVNTAFAAPLVARVADAFGNAVPGVTVTFSGPAVGAAATFPGGSTPVTDAAGKASAAPVANTTAGGYTATAAVVGVGATATFNLTNTPGAAATVVAVSGGGQSATVTTAFANPLVVFVTDAFGNPKPGVTVTFAGPAAGAGVTFPGGATPTTGATGKAAVAVTADAKAGSYTVTGSVGGGGTAATFGLTNTPGVPTTVTVFSGGGQSAAVNTAFASPLVALVTDALGNPVGGAKVSFVGPASGAGVIFPGGTDAVSDAAGTAGVTVVANTKTGSYAVTASGVGSQASFDLTNTAGAPVTVTVLGGGNQSAKVNHPFADPLSLRLTDAFGNVVPGAVVTFTGPAAGAGLTFPGGATPATDANGEVHAQAVANSFEGTYAVTATVAGIAGASNFAETNLTAGPGLVGYRDFAAGGAGSAVLYQSDATVRYAVTPFPGFTGQIRTAAGDFNGDGVADLVVGTGPGTATFVAVLDGVDQHTLFAVAPFEGSFTGGVFVAAGDVTGDGKADLVITPDEGGGPRVRVFDGATFTQLSDFFGIDDPAFRGGARAAVGDVNGDGRGDLLVAAGFGGGPRLAIFDGAQLGPAGGPKLVGDFFVFEQTLRNGVFVAAGDVNGDGYADVIAGGGPGGGPRVFALSGKDLVPGGTQTQLANFFAGDPNSRGGVRLAVKNLDGDARADIVVGAGTGAGSYVIGYLGRNTLANGTPPEQFHFDAFPGFNGGVFVG